MNTNIELKAYYDDLGKAEEICKQIGATLALDTNQTDIYFHTNNGRLKLRQNDKNDNSLIYYARMDSPLPRESDYHLIKLDDSNDLQQVLTKAYGEQIIVRKTRKRYEKDSYLINIDKIDGLGTFVEIEVDTQKAGGKEKAFELAEELKKKLDITEADILPFSYSDLITMFAAAEKFRNTLNGSENAGKLFLFDGVSCSGKTTLTQMIRDNKNLNIEFIPRYCTREPRANEKSESEYIFVGHTEFANLRAEGAFIEHREFQFGMSYGFPWKQTMDQLLSEHNGLGIINWGNVGFVKRIFPEAVTILIDAPVSTIEQRLISRGKNTQNQIDERLGNARKVEFYKPRYDHVINNDDGMLESAEKAIIKIISG